MHKSTQPFYQYTSGNHLRYEFIGSIEDRLCNRDLIVEIGQPRRPLLSLKDEAVVAAKLIYENMPKPIILCLSSGIDSQSLFQAFDAAKVPFEIAAFRYHFHEKKNLNAEDLVWTNSLRDKGYKFHDIDVDLFDFYLSSEFWTMAEETQCSSPQLVCHMKCMIQVPGTPILAWNVPNIFSNKARKPAIYVPYSKYFAYHRFFQSRKKPGVSFFFLYTPELFFSSLSLSTIRNLWKAFGENPDLDPQPRKFRSYTEGGFSFSHLPEKMTGFEVFKKEIASYTGGVDWTYDLLFRKPLELKFPEDRGIQLRMPTEAFKKALYPDKI